MSYCLTRVEVNKAACPPHLYLTCWFHLPASSAEIPALHSEDNLSQGMNYASAAPRLEAVWRRSRGARAPLNSSSLIWYAPQASLPVNKTYPNRTLISSAPQRKMRRDGKPLYLAAFEGAPAYSQIFTFCWVWSWMFPLRMHNIRRGDSSAASVRANLSDITTNILAHQILRQLSGAECDHIKGLTFQIWAAISRCAHQLRVLCQQITLGPQVYSPLYEAVSSIYLMSKKTDNCSFRETVQTL